jgi:hypothetical protein
LNIQAQSGSSTHWMKIKYLQPGDVRKGINTFNNIIHNYTPPSPLKKKKKIKQAQKFVEGYFYKKSENDFVDVYAQ